MYIFYLKPPFSFCNFIVYFILFSFSISLVSSLFQLTLMMMATITDPPGERIALTMTATIADPLLERITLTMTITTPLHSASDDNGYYRCPSKRKDYFDNGYNCPFSLCF
jgi:hypothetical protein